MNRPIRTEKTLPLMAEAALQEAVEKLKQKAIFYKFPLVVWHDGKVIYYQPKPEKKQKKKREAKVER